VPVLKQCEAGFDLTAVKVVNVAALNDPDADSVSEGLIDDVARISSIGSSTAKIGQRKWSKDFPATCWYDERTSFNKLSAPPL
jgi:hypothetical protein